MNKSVIVVAAGKGLRFGSELPKQFVTLLDKPVLMHTLSKFHEEDSSTQIILVLNPSHEDVWIALQDQFNFNIPHTIVFGGEERFHSVKNAIDHVSPNTDVIAIHDAVRPLVSAMCVRSLFEEAFVHGSAIPSLPLADSIRQWNGERFITANRTDFRTIQTPQCFRFDRIQNAYSQPYAPTFTDDAAVMEAAGHVLHLCEGERNNFKITKPEDFLLAEALMTRIAALPK
jgi:2-C-methyl-D-erythritol 4-phosphate cytidylyltransferase